MAEDLGVSPSYLNHLERNQRPLTAQMLMRLVDTYDIDIKSLSAEQSGVAAGDLQEVFSDQLFRDMGIARHEIAEVHESAPAIADAIIRLYHAYSDQHRRAEAGMRQAAEGGLAEQSFLTPSTWVRDFIQAQKNYFAELDERGEALAAELNPEFRHFWSTATERLATKHSVQIQIVPPDVLPDSLHRFDHHRKRLFLSQRLGSEGRNFALAYQLGAMEHGEALKQASDRAGAPDAPTRRLLKVSLANYLAAAILMPYERFREACETMAYDVEIIGQSFDTSFEQVCHRMTTLARPGARGIPFFMLRIDCAGNISKRYSSTNFPFSRFGGTCPRWNIHGAFKSPGRILRQIVETPDGSRYFTIARTVQRLAASYSDEEMDLAVGLGCELKYAPRLVYSRGLDLANPVATAIGPACRLCERPACPQRAAEPFNRTLVIDEFNKSISPYPFAGA